MIEFREYSFMENPRVPAEVNASRVSIKVCAAGDAATKCADGTVAADEADGVVTLKRDLSDARLKTALQVRRYRVTRTCSCRLS